VNPATGDAPAPLPGSWPTVVAIVGSTASGKSAVALALAQQIGAEIVNADAYQVYRGMDLGTAKPSRAEQAVVRHHLVDILDITEELSVSHYQQLGREVLADLGRRGLSAVVVGGSGLYVRALLDDLRFPGSDPAIRQRWEQALAQLGPQRLHAVLAERDPGAAAHILATNGRRIVRALEVGELTGSGFTARLPLDGPALVPHASFGLAVQRPILDERIAARVHGMVAAGLVDEVRGLLDIGLREGPTASRALGYPQMTAFIDGALELEAAVEATITATRAFARRQQRWFRRDPRTRWLDATEPAESTASAIAALLASQPRTLGA
jgi:tRNA dimethylallyltransferase